MVRNEKKEGHKECKDAMKGMKVGGGATKMIRNAKKGIKEKCKINCDKSSDLPW